ncbi:tRNA pseudouridine synthase Pus10 [Xenopus laevis]|uniref:tRNA pseudouridine synthase Pus10 n=1 Tax=Xenopus laevis TaxID=8355 RepID=PUS10_XENLA|nr:tRNA pseudouridine synthase Pus10 [Xenopus laevis]Q6ING2.1 RecName: Full=tRNA pseudouridine synthase Pus10; AltName: Full=tRNA pseudouridine 55 synthase; Short=Psi55 synthase; AltName: Full=tRNA pseudouridylate synthase; AltName: Full=tRNA-uridine isomerase [Xenopus laevis]AAH72319.1 MGC83083 protein [Xenopus laevis]
MLLIEEKYRSVAQVLLSSGTCSRCVLRFCCVGSPANYRLPCKEVTYELQKYLSHGDPAEENDTPPSKKAKIEEDTSSNEHLGNCEDVNGSQVVRICPLCLGILQQFCEPEFIEKVFVKINSAVYELKDFVLSISLPAQLSVREHSAWLQAKQEMGKHGHSLDKTDIVQLKEAYKWIIHPLLSDQLGIQADSKSLFEVAVVFTHPETDGDCHFLATVCRDCFKPTKNKQSVFTRMAVVKALEKIKEEDFRVQFPFPPSSPETTCEVVDIQCNHSPVFVAGRYNKYSRNLPQTPWIIDGERKIESSVEELITDHLVAAFRSSSFNFSSSGREDVDVRTLGKGRPFAIELLNPHKVQFTGQEIKALQQKINTSDKIKVRDLQIVSREAVAHMKEGEEEKTKCYCALIWIEKMVRNEDLQLLDGLEELTIAQKTPLRVLHRRPLASRSRTIHTMRTEYVDEHHFRLYLKTQAGTYIKEFVHGDFGRTKPNVGSIMETNADILELDVESVDVDWPPSLDD